MKNELIRDERYGPIMYGKEFKYNSIYHAALDMGILPEKRKISIIRKLLDKLNKLRAKK